VKETVHRALRSVTGLELQDEERVMHQVEQLTEAVQYIQKQITYLELHTIPDTPQDVRDQKDSTYRSVVERIKSLSMECKKMSDHNAQTYE